MTETKHQTDLEKAKELLEWIIKNARFRRLVKLKAQDFLDELEKNKK